MSDREEADQAGDARLIRQRLTALEEQGQGEGIRLDPYNDTEANPLDRWCSRERLDALLALEQAVWDAICEHCEPWESDTGGGYYPTELKEIGESYQALQYVSEKDAEKDPPSLTSPPSGDQSQEREAGTLEERLEYYGVTEEEMAHSEAAYRAAAGLREDPGPLPTPEPSAEDVVEGLKGTMEWLMREAMDRGYGDQEAEAVHRAITNALALIESQAEALGSTEFGERCRAEELEELKPEIELIQGYADSADEVADHLRTRNVALHAQLDEAKEGLRPFAEHGAALEGCEPTDQWCEAETLDGAQTHWLAVEHFQSARTVLAKLEAEQ